MKATGVIAGALICTVAVTAGLSASNQSPERPAIPSAPERNEPSSRVIRQLPPVTFGAPSAKMEQPRSEADADNRQRAEGALRELMARVPRQKIRTICGLTMIEQSADLDAKILMPPDPRGAPAMRRIEPDACTAPSGR